MLFFLASQVGILRLPEIFLICEDGNQIILLSQRIWVPPPFTDKTLTPEIGIQAHVFE